MKRWSWLTSLFSAAGLVVIGCNGAEVETELPPIVLRAGSIPECQKFWDWRKYEDADLLAWRLAERRDTTLFLSGPEESQNTAEYHDCQRFILGSSISSASTFSDGIFAIFAVKKADSVRAYIPDEVYGEAAAGGNALPAAKIFAESAYDSLGIKPGFNCLYLHPDGTGEWEAHLRRDGWMEEDCSKPIAVSDLGTAGDWDTLSVVRSREYGPDSTAYPVVARWIWHYRQDGFHEYKMGVWCDLAWCEVGSGSTQRPTPSFARNHVPPDVGDSKEFRVNGWFDEQILAGFDGTLRVSNIVGTIIPDPNLGRYTDESFREGRWLPTAKVVLSRLDAQKPLANPFDEKLNLALPEHGVAMNKVYLCRGGWADEPGNDRCQEDGRPEPLALDPEQVHRDTFPWWGKIERLGGGPPQTRYFKVARCPYQFDVAGTARWRWLSDDPGIWMRCVNGCCELRGGR